MYYYACYILCIPILGLNSLHCIQEPFIILSHLLLVRTHSLYFQHPSSIRAERGGKIKFLFFCQKLLHKLIISCLIHQIHNKTTRCSHADYEVCNANQGISSWWARNQQKW